MLFFQLHPNFIPIMKGENFVKFFYHNYLVLLWQFIYIISGVLTYSNKICCQYLFYVLVYRSLEGMATNLVELIEVILQISSKLWMSNLDH